MSSLPDRILSRPHLLLLPALKLAIHAATLPGYGIFRDELYYVACAKRLAWGYVDHPPLSIALLGLVRGIFGESLAALRSVPALAGAATLLILGLLVERLGGGRWAQVLAMGAALVAPYFLAVGHFYSMNALDLLIWTSVGYLMVDLAQRPRLSRWLVLGAVLGGGLLNKISVLWLGAGLFLGLLGTEHRRLLLTRGPWLAAGLSLLLFAPHLAWQKAQGWPTLEFIANATGRKMVPVSPADFVAGQVDLLGGWLIFAFALAGLGSLLLGRATGRLLAIAYLAVFAILILSGSSRPGYLGPATTWLLAGGGVALEAAARRISRPRWRGAFLALALTLLGLQGAVAAPFALPILPVESFIRYARSLGVEPSTSERKELAQLPQFFADMHGWRLKAEAAHRVADSLPDADRERACFFARNYGVAGALEYFAPSGSPPVLSGHNSYWLWGPGPCTGEVILAMGGEAEDYAGLFEQVEPAVTVDCGYCMPYENHQTLFILRGPRGSLEETWPRLKHFD
ncbi:MAG: glycosyltransferase family 39 protein [Acidobacteriota bacterium]